MKIKQAKLSDTIKVQMFYKGKEMLRWITLGKSKDLEIMKFAIDKGYDAIEARYTK